MCLDATISRLRHRAADGRSELRKEACSSLTFLGSVLLVLCYAVLSYGIWVLSALKQLNRPGAFMLIFACGITSVFLCFKLTGGTWRIRGFRWRRFRRPLPLLYALCAIAALVGGVVHAPTNHDAFSYRIPRILHWLSEGGWHWIGGADPRMDFSGLGFETLMLPAFGAFETLRFAFLINAVAYLLFPGLIFVVLSGLGVRNSVASVWMWVIPCGSCFVMQAGSIGNDFLGCILVLAAVAFGLRALRAGSVFDLSFSILSAAAMTGVKASNLPLLLPVAICLFSVLVKWPRRIPLALFAVMISLPLSFAPTALENIKHTGDWAGSVNSPLKLDKPAAGLVGNSILIGSACLVPAVLPQAERLNSDFNRLDGASFGWIKEAFVDFRMTHPQLASEENSGLGLGVSIAMFLGLAASYRSIRIRKVYSLGGMVFAGFWFALGFYMVKLGNCGAPRLVAPYYVGLLGLPLLLIDRGSLFRSRWWVGVSSVFIVPILLALLCSPARPLIPMGTLVDALIKRGVDLPILERMKTVYEVYSHRDDVYWEVRELLPTNATHIGFSGTSGDSEYSFWVPLGTRTVADYGSTPDGRPSDPRQYDAIVASTWGVQDRFEMTPQQLARLLGWEVFGSVEVRSLASADPVMWYVLTPLGSNSGGADRGDR